MLLRRIWSSDTQYEDRPVGRRAGPPENSSSSLNSLILSGLRLSDAGKILDSQLCSISNSYCKCCNTVPFDYPYLSTIFVTQIGTVFSLQSVGQLSLCSLLRSFNGLSPVSPFAARVPQTTRVPSRWLWLHILQVGNQAIRLSSGATRTWTFLVASRMRVPASDAR